MTREKLQLYNVYKAQGNERECAMIRRYILDVEDKQMQYILWQKYIRRRSNRSIALKLGYSSETTVRKKLKKFFKRCEKCEKSDL